MADDKRIILVEDDSGDEAFAVRAQRKSHAANQVVVAHDASHVIRGLAPPGGQ